MPRFCAACGTQVADAVTACPKCGTATLASVSGGSGGAAPQPSGGGSQDNLVSALAYIAIVGLILLFIEPYSKNKTVRFHAVQGVGLGITWFVASIVFTLIPIIGWFILNPLLMLGMIITIILCAVKAYQGTRIKLPVIGDFAEKQAASV
jgi:uncharacterized membrane protein